MKNEKCEYTLNQIDDINITKMLEDMNLKVNGYMFGTLMPKLNAYAVLGSLANINLLNVVAAFDNNAIYFLVMSKFTNKKIVNIITIPFNEVESTKVSNFMFGIAKRIHIKTTNNSKIILQANNKFKLIENQTNSISNLLRMLNK